MSSVGRAIWTPSPLILVGRLRWSLAHDSHPDGPDLHHDGLALVVGCEFELESTFPIAAVMQVAPCPDSRVQMHFERWDIGSEHHSYTDLYGNRCA